MSVLGIDLGGTKIAVGVVDLVSGAVRSRVEVPTEADGGPEHVLQRLIAAARGARREFESGGSDRISAVGIGAPGPIHFPSGSVAKAPNLPGWQMVPLRDRVGEALGLPAELDNDANVAGLAEHTYGAARGAASSAFVTISTGIGAGLILNHRIWRGANGIAGEIGHFRPVLDGPACGFGGPGCLEALASGPAIARAASAAYGEEMDTRAAFERAARGESKALEVVARAAQVVGVSLASLQKFVDPEVWVLGGGVSRQEKLFIEPIRRAAELAMEGIGPIRIRTALLGRDAGIIGAATLWNGKAG